MNPIKLRCACPYWKDYHLNIYCDQALRASFQLEDIATTSTEDSF